MLILSVAVHAPLRRSFDYLPPPELGSDTLQPGIRLLVPFGRGTRIGYLIDVRHEEDPSESARLKAVIAVVDTHPLLAATDLRLLRWASAYYHHPLGEVIGAAFPPALRSSRPARLPDPDMYLGITGDGREFGPETLARAPRQRALLLALRAAPAGLGASELRALDRNWHKTAAALTRRGLIQAIAAPAEKAIAPLRHASGHELNSAQRAAVREVSASFGRYAAFLLEGVTGSGKTEVYLHLTAAALQRGEQVMVLLPEISLTPQLEQRFREHLTVPIAVFHSRLGETERLTNWLRVQRGELPILLGTRSAVFAPLARPGLVIIDEEHDTSYKQQEGFRFSGRDVAIQRARLWNVPVVMGSATPALESLWNAERGRYRKLHLQQRAGGAATPRLELLDIRHQRLRHGLSPHLISLLNQTLARQEQVLLFLNRRGFAPTLLCQDCGWVAPCPRCDARLVMHLRDSCLRCHYCGFEAAPIARCPACSGTDLRPLGHGTERLEQSLAELFPGRTRLRIDRDTTRTSGHLAQHLERVRSRDVQILLGTQMLAKGHHFPGITLVVVVDADAFLFSTDFRAPERMAQMIMQVAGRAGRAEKPGMVVLQTRHPGHPLLNKLIENGYDAVAADILDERRALRLPPFSHMALCRAEASDEQAPVALLNRIREHLTPTADAALQILGPAPAPMLRQSGRYRYQLALTSLDRRTLHAAIQRIESFTEANPAARKVRWSLDIDPIDCY
jgi:primosomal protein N' (replication factor Y)